jgi:predicted lipoprotein with Yx(FWY)xxD motif
VRRSALSTVVLLAVLLATACGSTATKTSTTTKSRTPTTAASISTTSSGRLAVKTATIKPYGSALVAENGHPLYIFVPDDAKKVTCTGTCTKIWPPLKLPGGAKAVASGQAKAALLGTDPDPSGGRVVTYDGWPLYAYVLDTSAGVAHGQGIGLNGGLWYLISPSGKVITKRVVSSSSGYNSGY